MKTIKEVLNFVSQKDKEFSVRFIKRGTQTLREMKCKTGVTEFLKGGDRAYDPNEHYLVNVYEVNVGYRCFPLDGLKEIEIEGEWHKIVTPEEAQR